MAHRLMAHRLTVAYLKKSGAVGALTILSLGGVACSPIVHHQGYAPRAAELHSIQVGVDSRESVVRTLGRPSTIGSFDSNNWYYISMKAQTYAFYKPEVVEQTVVTISFNEAGTVSEVGRYGLEDGRVIDLVTKTTPTSGRKLTILQQIFQNLGKFNKGANLLDKLNPPR